MAQIVAKAMAKGANVDKLMAEFADELDALGVRVAALEKKADNVKITGQLRWSYQHNKNTAADGTEGRESRHRFRTRLWFAGAINDNWTYRGRLENTQDFHRTGKDVNNTGEDANVSLNRAYIEGRLGGAFVEAGRLNLALGESNIYDSSFDGFTVKYGKKVRLGAYYGKPTAAQEDFASGNGDLGMKKAYGVNAGVDLGKKVTLDVAWDRFEPIEDAHDDLDIISAALNAKLTDQLGLGFLYLHTNSDNEDWIPEHASKNGYVIKLDYGGASYGKPHSWGIGAKYFHTPAGSQIAHGWTYNLMPIDQGAKGYMVYANYTLFKNMRYEIIWADMKGREDDTMRKKTLWNEFQLRF
jgi:hypothetical protein